MNSKDIQSLVALACGAVLQGAAMALFLFPHNIASGGAAGIAILAELWFDIPHAVTIWGLNLSLLLVSLRWIGYKSSFKTIYTVTITSFTISLIQLFPISFAVPIYLSMVIGAGLFGFGIGVLFRNGASSGGLAIIAHIFYQVQGILPGKSLFVMNMFVFLIVSYFIDWRLFVFAVVTQWVATKVLNQVVIYPLTKNETKDTAVSA
ncbi:YitT family protein [Halalkalibacter alkalisediminis]|uniref:YitT family protein n=1 Tax=Halalkalibacter alkalisediminis TaxID=935616 RepID=A0ABV6N9V1_9BACI|nr:YitT family protein [Halalkalibacter alkalisediminis]